ncbi:MAG: 4-hydroxy-tetrahydrodipicolinate synthase [Chlorobi bacterium]|nr:4-hydroxy-tetrahydrodipicolinate synthase [Chlorobiota bacterium]
MIKGTGVAIVTPFNKNNKVDIASLEKLINYIIDGGVDFIVSLGTTSEAVTLSSDEQQLVMDVVVAAVAKRVPIIMGLGGNNTQAVIDKIKTNDFSGIDAVLSVAPYYNKPNQRGIYAHFAEIAKLCPKPIILYNVPGRTSSNISAETCLKLANDFDNIIAVKEASGNMSQVMEILKNRPRDFSVLSGDDALTFPMMALGGDGVISVVANAYPKEFSNMIKLCLENNFVDSRKIHFSLLAFIDLLFADGNPAGIKAALEIMGIMKNNLRLPMVSVEDEHYKEIEGFVSNYKQL